MFGSESLAAAKNWKVRAQRTGAIGVEEVEGLTDLLLLLLRKVTVAGGLLCAAATTVCLR